MLSVDCPTNSWPPLSPGSADFAGRYDNDVRMSLAHVWEDRGFLAGLWCALLFIKRALGAGLAHGHSGSCVEACYDSMCRRM